VGATLAGLGCLRGTAVKAQAQQKTEISHAFASI
jgi:hypothetical protein